MTLTPNEATRLKGIEQEIEQGFLLIAEGLRVIRDEKLYREFKTIEAYCQERWNRSRSWLYQQLASAEVVRSLPEKSMSTFVDKSVRGLTEPTARALTDVPLDQRPEVIEHAAAKGEPITRKSIKESAKVVAEKNGNTTEQGPRDKTGWLIPTERLEFFRRGETVKKYLDHLSEVRGFIRRIGESKKDLLFAECHAQEMLQACDEIFGALKRAIPFAVCPTCQGKLADACMMCRGRGVMSQFLWETSVTEEAKEIRKRTLEDK